MTYRRSSSLQEHHFYLADTVRNDAYLRAMQAVVPPGGTVLDLGCGTGLLGLLAIRAGAGHVHAVDVGPILSLAQEVFRVNGYEDRVTFHRGWSTEVVLPERVDAVFCDQLGTMGVGARLFEAFSDARARHLKPGGVTLPCRMTVEAAAVESPDRWSLVGDWDRGPEGLDLSPVRRRIAHARLDAEWKAADLLGPGVLVLSGDPSDPAALHLSGEAVLPVTRDGTLHGIATWMRATLAPGIELTNDPRAPGSMNSRHQVYLPLEEPLPVRAGDAIPLRLSMNTHDEMVAWTVTAGGRTFRHSEFAGALGTAEDFRALDPAAVPVEGPRATAARVVLAALEEGATLGAILERVEGACSGAFPSPASRDIYVRELLDFLR